MGSKTIGTQLEAFLREIGAVLQNIILKEIMSQQKHSADEPQMFAFALKIIR